MGTNIPSYDIKSFRYPFKYIYIQPDIHLNIHFNIKNTIKRDKSNNINNLKIF